MEKVDDIDLMEHLSEYDAILFCTNTYCYLSGDFPRRVSLLYPYVDKANLSTKYGDPSKKGNITICNEDGQPTFVIMYVVDWPKSKTTEDWIDYEALEKCLKFVNVSFKGKKLACPMIGTYWWDGKGNKDKILGIIEATLTDVDITVYDYVPLSREEEYKASKEKAKKILEERGKDAYREYIRGIKQRRKETLAINGHSKGL